MRYDHRNEGYLCKEVRGPPGQRSSQQWLLKNRPGEDGNLK